MSVGAPFFSHSLGLSRFIQAKKQERVEKMGRNDGLNERLLESENNRLSDQLAGKISKLKAISIEMKVPLQL